AAMVAGAHRAGRLPGTGGWRVEYGILPVEPGGALDPGPDGHARQRSGADTRRREPCAATAGDGPAGVPDGRGPRAAGGLTGGKASADAKRGGRPRGTADD